MVKFIHMGKDLQRIQYIKNNGIIFINLDYIEFVDDWQKHPVN